MKEKMIYISPNKEVIMMDSKRPSVLELLEQEKEHHLEQIRRLNIAITALKDDGNQSSGNARRKRRVSWSQEIDKLFSDTSLELRLSEVQTKLAERGYPEARDKKMKPTIYQTLARKVKANTFGKTENGKYYKKVEEGRLFNPSS